jgi:hypothetical protein
MRRITLAAAVVAAVVVAALGAAAATASGQALNALEPGGITPFTETVDVNIVYVGMGNPHADVAPQLPATSSPVVRSSAFYGEPADLGIAYTYAYNPVVASDAWTTAFYAKLDQLAGTHTAGETLSLFQQLYNAETNNERQLVESANQWIDAFEVEKYLALNAPPGVDTTEPTIYFIDRSLAAGWYPHVYVKTNEPDPDTNTNFGQVRSTRKLTAWGGTPANDEENPLGSTRRVWFYDLSAGPDGWQGGWNVDDPDDDGDGEADYRIPPAWHYTGGYTHPGYPGSVSLGTDLGKVARFVGLDLLFTTSPLYPPFFTPDRVPNTVNLDVTTVEGWNGVDASATLYKSGLFLAEESELPTGYTLTLDANVDVPFKGDVKNCYLQWVKNVRCFNDHVQYPAFANPFLNWALTTDLFLDGNADYEAAMINYAVGTKPKGAGLLGYADDNYLNGTQSGVFSFVYPDAFAGGYGLTTTMIHEYGHHSSMSHPHDGYDSNAAADDTATGPGPDGVFGDFGPGGSTYFAWLGDMSNSMMSYIDLNWDFSQFDRDNSARHHAAGFAVIANRVADAIDGFPAAAGALASADGDLEDAQDAFAAHNYPVALQEAESAYRTLLAWADGNGVAIAVRTPSTWTVLPDAKGGVGLGRKLPAGRIDLDDRHNAKRLG